MTSTHQSGPHTGPQNGAGLITAADLRAAQEQSRQRIAEVQRRALGARERYLSDTVSATSPDRAVTVTVNPAGNLVDLIFDQRAAAKLGLDRLQSTIMSTYRSACADAARRSQEIVAELAGDNSDVLAMMRADAPSEDPLDALGRGEAGPK